MRLPLVKDGLAMTVEIATTNYVSLAMTKRNLDNLLDTIYSILDTDYY